MLYFTLQIIPVIIWVISSISSGDGVSFCTESPTIWTKSYISAVYGLDPNDSPSVNATLFTALSELEPRTSWLNAVSQREERALQPGRTAIGIHADSILPEGSSASALQGFGLITTQNTPTYLREGSTFYQLRETKQLGFTYTVIAVTSTNQTLISVIIISGTIGLSTIRVTFKNGVDVPKIVTNFRYKKVTGNIVSIWRLGYRDVVKFEADEDLTGTQIVGVREAEISVISGSMSRQNTDRFVFLDHLVSDNEAGSFYIVFGLPDMEGSALFRIVAITLNTTVELNETTSITLSASGDFYDVVIFRNSFRYVRSTYPIIIALFAKGDGSNVRSNMIVFQETSAKNPTEYTFPIPSLQTDVNFRHYLVVITNRSDHEGMRLNGQALPPETVWVPVNGTEYLGGYVPLNETLSMQTIQNENGTPFNAYLVGIGDDSMYGSALISNESPLINTDELKFSLERTFCERTGKLGNYNSSGTPMEVYSVKIRGKRRMVSYVIKHLRVAHLQACELMCLLYSNCKGVNYTESPTEEVNCDLIMDGPSVLLKDKIWKIYQEKM